MEMGSYPRQFQAVSRPELPRFFSGRKAARAESERREDLQGKPAKGLKIKKPKAKRPEEDNDKTDRLMDGCQI
jgi:hypothetical protein